MALKTAYLRRALVVEIRFGRCACGDFVLCENTVAVWRRASPGRTAKGQPRRVWKRGSVEALTNAGAGEVLMVPRARGLRLRVPLTGDEWLSRLPKDRRR